MILLLLFISFLAIYCNSAAPYFKDCNFTDLRFQSKYSLGKQDELNNTFDAIGPKIAIPDLKYPINSYTNYSFTGIKSSL